MFVGLPWTVSPSDIPDDNKGNFTSVEDKNLRTRTMVVNRSLCKRTEETRDYTKKNDKGLIE